MNAQRSIQRKYVIILIITIILIDGIYLRISCLQNPDEFTSIAVPAFLSGMDWSDLVANNGFHGYGFTILLTPFFYLAKLGVNLYKICLVGCLCVRIGCVLLSFRMLTKLFDMTPFKAFFICALCNFSTFNPDNGEALSALSEIPFTFILILLSFFMAKFLCCNKSKHKIISLIIIAIALAYSPTIHSRAIILWIAFACVGLIYFFREKDFSRENIRNLLIFVIALIVFILLVYSLNNNIFSELYAKAASNVSNTTVSELGRTTRSLKRLTNPEFFKETFLIFISLVSSYSLYTFGVIWIILALNIWYIVNYIKNKEEQTYAPSKAVWYLSIFSMLGWLGMNLAISISSVNAVLNDGNYRWLTYIRYAKPFTWMLCICGLIIFWKIKINKIAVWIMSSIGVVLSCATFFFKIAPKLDSNGYGLSMSIFRRVFAHTYVAVKYFNKLMVICLIVYCIIALLMIYENHYMGLTVYLAITLAVFGYSTSYSFTIDASHKAYSNASIALLSSQEINFNVLYSGSRDYNYDLRVSIPEMDMHYIKDFTDVDLKEDMLLTNSEDVVENYTDSHIISLDENEYAITNNENICDFLIDNGYEEITFPNDKY